MRSRAVAEVYSCGLFSSERAFLLILKRNDCYSLSYIFLSFLKSLKLIELLTFPLKAFEYFLPENVSLDTKKSFLGTASSS